MHWQCTLDLSLSLSLMMCYAITQRQGQTYGHNLWQSEAIWGKGRQTPKNTSDLICIVDKRDAGASKKLEAFLSSCQLLSSLVQPRPYRNIWRSKRKIFLKKWRDHFCSSRWVVAESSWLHQAECKKINHSLRKIVNCSNLKCTWSVTS